MEINRCNRCGNFYASEGHVCSKCIVKDNAEILKFKDFLSENQSVTSIHDISYQTGITHSNLTRFLNSNEFKNLGNNININ